MTRKTYMIKLLEWKQFKDVALATYPLELIEYTIYFRQDGSFSRLHYEEDGGDNGYLEATDIEDAKVQAQIHWEERLGQVLEEVI